MDTPKYVREVFQSYSDKFASLFNNEKLSDVQFLVDEDRKIYGHSLILSLASPVFENQFDQTLNEQKLIPLLDEKYDTVYSFLKFIYTDDVHVINYDNCFDLFKLALKYETYDLEQNVLAYICRNTRVRDILKHFDFFVNLNYRFMSEHYKCEMAELLKFHLDLEQYLKLSLKSVHAILDINIVYNDVNLYEIIHAILKWGENKCTEYDKDMRHIRQFFGEAAKKIKFTSMSMAEITTFMYLYPSFFEEAEVAPLLRAIKKIADTEVECNCDFTMESYTKQALRVGIYAYLQGEQIFSLMFNTRESALEILGIWIGATREARTCQVTLLDENGDVRNQVITNVMMINQYAFPIKFRTRVLLKPHQQYQIIINYERTDCGVAEWNALESDDIVGANNVELVQKCQCIRKIHFEEII